ncbi:MAG: Hsp20/alpha crystallin family protein [Woeseiaceae bacterium]|nr:Hsp20/alpha crystallin family protein [Woeseiaceae bacterium]
MTLARFEPWSVIDLLHRDLNRLTRGRGGFADGDDSVADWVPAVDIIEESNRFVLRADLPGVVPENIDVSMDKGVLTVSGQRDAIASAEDATFQRLERANGRFLRRFSLPESADADSISARSNNGILEVTIPKQPEIKARRITVESD